MEMNLAMVESFKSRLESNEAVEAAKEIAELAKDEEWREFIGNSDLLPFIAQKIIPSESSLTIQLLRCFGNLTYNNGFNRDVISETMGAVDRIFQCIDFQLDLTLSVLVNLTMENRTTQKMITDLNGIPKILSKISLALNNQDISFVISGLRLLANVLEIDLGPKELLLANGLDTLKLILRSCLEEILGLDKSGNQIAINERLDALDACGLILETIVEYDDIQKEIISSSFLSSDLLWMIDALYTLIVDIDPSLIHVNYSHSYEFQGIVADLLKTFCVLVTLLSLNDFYMKDLASNHKIVNTFKRWTQTDNVTQRIQIELSIAGALCLGNLARSGDTCSKLVKDFEVDEVLIILLNKEVQKLNKDHQLSSANLIQAIISALKNITLADSCKEKLSSPLLFQTIMDLLESLHSRQLTCNCISILKNLTTGKSDSRNIYRIILNSESYEDMNMVSELSSESHSLIQIINILSWCSTDEADSNIRNEAGRLNANLIKHIHKHNISSLGKALLNYGCVTLLLQIVTGFILTSPPPHKMSLIDFEMDKYVDFQPVRVFQTFPVVQNEGIVALVLLCSLYEEALSMIARHTDAAGSELYKDSSTLDSITALNASHLLLLLCQAEFRNIANDQFGELISSINRMAQNRPKIEDHMEPISQKNELSFPTNQIGLLQNGRKHYNHDAIRYRKELELNVDQQGGLRRALHIVNSMESLEEITGSLLDIFEQNQNIV